MSKLAEIGVEITNGNLTPVGTVAELIGKKGKLSLSLGNLMNKESRVFFDLTGEDGTTRRVFGSRALSKMVKNQDLKKGQLLGLTINQYEMTEGERKGEIGYVVSAPRSESITINGDVAVEKAVGQRIADHKELATW